LCARDIAFCAPLSSLSVSFIWISRCPLPRLATSFQSNAPFYLLRSVPMLSGHICLRLAPVYSLWLSISHASVTVQPFPTPLLNVEGAPCFYDRPVSCRGIRRSPVQDNLIEAPSLLCARTGFALLTFASPLRSSRRHPTVPRTTALGGIRHHGSGAVPRLQTSFPMRSACSRTPESGALSSAVCPARSHSQRFDALPPGARVSLMDAISNAQPRSPLGLRVFKASRA